MDLFLRCLAVGAGGFFGSICRYGISQISVLQKDGMPLSTLLVNVAGAVLIGMFVKFFQVHTEISEQMLLFLKVGICGGFTTFSTFALESAGMLENGHVFFMLIYMALSVFLCVGGVFLGQWLI